MQKERISHVDVILTSYLHVYDHNFLILIKTLCECATKLMKKQLCPVYLFDEIHMEEKINSLREKRYADIDKICTRKNVFRIETR